MHVGAVHCPAQDQREEEVSETMSTSLEERLEAAVEVARRRVIVEVRQWGEGDTNEKGYQDALARYGDVRALEGRWAEHRHRVVGSPTCNQGCPLEAEIERVLAEEER